MMCPNRDVISSLYISEMRKYTNNLKLDRKFVTNKLMNSVLNIIENYFNVT